MPRRNALALGLALLLATPARGAAAVLEAPATAPEDPAAATEDPGATAEATTGTWLRLRCDDDNLRDRMDAAMHDEARARGLVEGESALQIDDVECDYADTACLTALGRRLHTETLVFGAVSSDGEVPRLRVARLDVATGTLVREYQQPLTSADRSGDGFVRVVTDAIAALAIDGDPAFERTPTPSFAMPPPVPPPPAPQLPLDAAPDPGRGRLRWGLAERTPAWQWAGFGTSVALGTIALVGTIVTTTMLRRSLPKQLDRAVQDSLVDSKPSNDIPPSSPDYCVVAHQSEDGGKTVKNAKVDGICNVGNATEKFLLASAITFGIGLAGTLVFTGLLFVHRGKPLRRDARRPAVAGWTGRGSGGVVLSGRF